MTLSISPHNKISSTSEVIPGKSSKKKTKNPPRVEAQNGSIVEENKGTETSRF